MDLKQLTYFVTVVERGSFSRAAVALNLAQPSLSRQVALLENELGHRLLDRTGRGVSMTQAGEALLVHAKVMLDAAEQAKFQIKEMRPVDSKISRKITQGFDHRRGRFKPVAQR
jgi:LysR family nitrogen assimilation transcriptional regulator